MAKLSLIRVNALNRPDFVAAFADVAEASPWVAEAAERARPFPTRQAMIDTFAAAVHSAPEDRQQALLCAHPDLGSRLAMAEASRREQQGAGLDRLTDEEHSRLVALNAAYRERFGIPFIFAVRGAETKQILDALMQRLERDSRTEYEAAIEEVCKIMGFRLEDRVAG